MALFNLRFLRAKHRKLPGQSAEYFAPRRQAAPNRLTSSKTYSIPSPRFKTGHSCRMLQTPIRTATENVSGPDSRADDESPPKYEYIEDSEQPDCYCPGGFCPVKLGDRLHNGRYSIIQNLGYGGNSTVWLASDLQEKQPQLVAIKIKAAKSSFKSQELEILRSLQDHPLVRKLLHDFVEYSPNGAHHCLVMEAASCSLTQAKASTPHAVLTLSTARAITADLILLVQYLHKRGIVHGDIHCDNILLQLPDEIRTMTDPSKFYRKFGDPILAPVVRVDRKPLGIGVPQYIVGPANIEVRSDEIQPKHLPIMLSDFGSSYHPKRTQRTTAYTLEHLVPPEALFNDQHGEPYTLSFPSEMWTLGCTVFEIIGSGGPFSTLGGGIRQDYVTVMGKFPDLWWLQWKERGDFFNEDATIDYSTGAPPQVTLEERYDWFVTAARRRYDMEVQDEDERKAFLTMIRMMIRYENRSTIDEVVKCEWMQRWGLSARDR